MSKDDRKLLKGLCEQGCEVRRTGTGHLRVTLHGQHVVTLAGTPSDRRSGKNARAAIRRAGLTITT